MRRERGVEVDATRTAFAAASRRMNFSRMLLALLGLGRRSRPAAPRPPRASRSRTSGTRALAHGAPRPLGPAHRPLPHRRRIPAAAFRRPGRRADRASWSSSPAPPARSLAITCTIQARRFDTLARRPVGERTATSSPPRSRSRRALRRRFCGRPALFPFPGALRGDAPTRVSRSRAARSARRPQRSRVVAGHRARGVPEGVLRARDGARLRRSRRRRSAR